MASEEDPSKTFIAELPKTPSTHWNITGMNAASIIRILKSIINDRETFKDAAKFTFNIKRNKETIYTWSEPDWQATRQWFYQKKKPKGEGLTGLTVSRKTAKNLAVRRKNWKILTVSRKTC